MGTLYFERGWVDASDLESSYQCVGIDSETHQVVDDNELTFVEQIPNMEFCHSTGDVIIAMQISGWKLID